MYQYKQILLEDKDQTLCELRGTFIEDLYGCALADILLMVNAAISVLLPPGVMYIEASYLARAFFDTQMHHHFLGDIVQYAGNYDNKLYAAALFLAKFLCLQYCVCIGTIHR